MPHNGHILTFGGPAHVAEGRFFSTIGDMSTVEGDWLEAHPEFNQVLHDVHVETAGQMIDYVLHHAPEECPGPRIGDSVVVKEGTPHPDLGTGLGGWQGRVMGLRRGQGDTVLCYIFHDPRFLGGHDPRFHLSRIRGKMEHRNGNETDRHLI